MAIEHFKLRKEPPCSYTTEFKLMGCRMEMSGLHVCAFRNWKGSREILSLSRCFMAAFRRKLLFW
jgi:hypothetical protein